VRSICPRQYRNRVTASRSRRLRHGLRQLRMHPVQVGSASHITQSRHFPMRRLQLAPSCRCSAAAPRIIERHRVAGGKALDPGHGLLGLLGVVQDTLGLMPACRARPAAARASMPCVEPGNLRVAFDAVSKRLAAPSPSPTDTADLAFGYCNTSKPLWTGSLTCCSRAVEVVARASCRSFTPRARPVGVRHHALHVGPRLEQGAPRLPRAVRTALPAPRHAVRFHRDKHRVRDERNSHPSITSSQGLTGLIQHGQIPPARALVWATQRPHGGTTRHPTLGP